MGADLYIQDLPKNVQYKEFERAIDSEEFDVGYFRDCYNGMGLFAIMTHTLDHTFSWWWTIDRKELFTFNENRAPIMHSEGVKEWWKEMQPFIRKFIKRKTFYRGEYQSKNDTYKKVRITNVEDIGYIREHAEQFARFHILACELNKPIKWSV